jgi:hypothetical protein
MRTGVAQMHKQDAVWCPVAHLPQAPELRVEAVAEAAARIVFLNARQSRVVPRGNALLVPAGMDAKYPETPSAEAKSFDDMVDN